MGSGGLRASKVAVTMSALSYLGEMGAMGGCGVEEEYGPAQSCPAVARGSLPVPTPPPPAGNPFCISLWSFLRPLCQLPPSLRCPCLQGPVLSSLPPETSSAPPLLLLCTLPQSFSH